MLDAGLGAELTNDDVFRPLGNPQNEEAYLAPRSVNADSAKPDADASAKSGGPTQALSLRSFFARSTVRKQSIDRGFGGSEFGEGFGFMLMSGSGGQSGSGSGGSSGSGSGGGNPGGSGIWGLAEPGFYAVGVEPVSDLVEDDQYVDFWVHFSDPNEQGASVQWSTEEVEMETDASNAPAESDVDFESASGTIVIPPGVPTASTLVRIKVKHDNHLEPTEWFKLRLSGPTNGSQLSALEEEQVGKIVDATLLVVDATVAWQDVDETWVTVPDDEVLWADENHRWTASVNNSMNLPIESIEWLKMPWDEWIADPSYDAHPISGWTSFASASGLSPAFGELPLGIWAVTPKVNVPGSFVVLETPEMEQVIDIVQTKWSPSAGAQKFLGDGVGETKVFPERDKPTSQMTGVLHDKVNIDVTIDAEVAPSKRAVVHLKVFDPDHDFDPVLAEQVSSLLDPNDGIGVTNPEDNIVAGVFARPALQSPPTFGELGGSLLEDELEFLPGQGVKKTVQFQITARQPGNNFIAVAHPREGYLTSIEFADDGVTLRVEGEGNVSGDNRTGILTVWRTLHLELDGMKKPDAALGLLGGFNETDPNSDDPFPTAAIAPPPWALVAEQFKRAYVEVADDLGPYESILGPKKKAEFEQYFGLADHGPMSEGNAIANGDDVRNVASESDFWVVQLISGYDYVVLKDIDDDGDTPDTNTEGWIAGYATDGGNDGPTFVFSETVRDVWTNDPRRFAGLTLATFQERVSLHEVAHRFDMTHTDSDGMGNEGPLDPMNNLAGSAIANEFTLRQLARIQATERSR